jgi:metal transporter CNNM
MSNEEGYESFVGYLSNWFMTLLCVAVGALASGLTIGLLSIDPVQLLIKERASTSEVERQQASTLLPIIAPQKRHLLLVSLLLMNAISNEALPLFLDNVLPVYAAVLVSVTLVLVFGEIIPSALFAGNSQLRLAARFAPAIRIILLLFYPLAYPISKVLDAWLPHDGDDGHDNNGGGGYAGMYTRGELTALVRIQHEQRLASRERRQTAAALRRMTLSISRSRSNGDASEQSADSRTNNICVDEVTMVEGALSLMTKKAIDAYTPLSQVFCLDAETVLDEAQLMRIYRRGHSRIPVYVRQEEPQQQQNQRQQQNGPNDEPPSQNSTTDTTSHQMARFCGILLTRHLLFVRSEDNRKVKTLPLMQPTCTSPATNLIDLINIFQTGGRANKGGHLAVVCTDPVVATQHLDAGQAIPSGVLGVITLEDVLEELLQEEIWDEHDHRGEHLQATERARRGWDRWKQFVVRKKSNQQQQQQQQLLEVAAEEARQQKLQVVAGGYEKHDPLLVPSVLTTP